MQKEQIEKLEFRDEAVFRKLKPISKHIKEVPYTKNNPAQQKVVVSATATNANDIEQANERRKKIDELKR